MKLVLMAGDSRCAVRVQSAARRWLMACLPDATNTTTHCSCELQYCCEGGGFELCVLPVCRLKRLTVQTLPSTNNTFHSANVTYNIATGWGVVRTEVCSPDTCSIEESKTPV